MFRNNLEFPVNYKLSIILVIFITTVFILTNFVITGYPLFPIDFLGPFHDYSINSEQLENLKIATLNWHRFQNSIGNHNYWVISYFKTRNGLINIIFWFVPSLLSIIITIYLKRFYGASKSELKINYLLFSLTITVLVCFLTLIPVVNYYPWIPHCIIFLFLILLNRLIITTKIRINFYKITFSILTIFVLLNSIYSYSNNLIIKNIPKSIFQEPILKIPDYKTLEISPKKWISFQNNESSKNIHISIPLRGDQCWGIEPPCTFSGGFLKNYE